MLVISENCLACDTVCCYLMGQDPHSIEHLELLYKRGMGPLDINDIEVINKDYLESKKMDYIMPDPNLEMSPNMHAYIGTKKACLGGCVGMIKGILDTYGLVKGWHSVGELNIILGDGLELTPEELVYLKKNKKRNIVYGDCAKQYKKLGTFFKGCPPDYTKSLIKIWLLGPMGMNPHLTLQYVAPYRYAKAWGLHILQRIFRF